MKKVFYSVALFAAVAMLASCGGMKSDAKKMANKMCECALLAEDMDNIDMEKLETCSNELESMGDELDKKYTEKEDQKALAKAFAEELKSCKAKDADKLVEFFESADDFDF